MTRLFTISSKCLLSFLNLNSELYLIIVRVKNKKKTIDNQVRVIEQIFVLDPVK